MRFFVTTWGCSGLFEAGTRPSKVASTFYPACATMLCFTTSHPKKKVKRSGSKICRPLSGQKTRHRATALHHPNDKTVYLQESSRYQVLQAHVKIVFVPELMEYSTLKSVKIFICTDLEFPAQDIWP